MKLDTLRFGEIEVEEDKIITFQQGIPGFEGNRRFIILEPDESLPFSFIQSVEDGDLAFIVANPFAYFPEYNFELPETIQKEMDIADVSDVTICSVVTIDISKDIYVNLLAPIVMNTRRRTGRQIILHQSNYKTKHLIPRHNSEEQPIAKEE